MPSRWMHRLAWFLACLLLAACVPTLPSLNPSNPPQPDPVAVGHAQRGDYLEAAQRYLELADRARPREAGHYRLLGIEYLLRLDRLDEAKAQLTRVRVDKKDTDLLARYYLAHARLSLVEEQVPQASANLREAEKYGIPAEYRKSHHRLTARIAEANQDYLAAARARAALDPLLTAGFEQQGNQESLWRDLTQHHQGPLPAITGADAWNGWLALARLARETPPGHWGGSLPQWRRQFPNHRAEQHIVPRLLGGQLATTTPTQQPRPLPRQLGDAQYAAHIALLLPLSGKYAAPAQAIRDGFLAGWYGERAYPVRIYPAAPEQAQAAYRQAVAQGAKLVVGPLQKEAVVALTGNPASLSVPTLLLNTLDEQRVTPLAPQIFEFSLAPEDEARLLAEQARREGHVSAGVLYPDNAKGERMSAAFTRFFDEQGGMVTTTAAYDETTYSTAASTIARAFRDQQISVLFLVSRPRDARQLRPMLNYHLATNIPILALGQIYSGRPSAHYDSDLNGIRFVEMPWLFSDTNLDLAAHNTLARDLPEHLENYQRLAAFGLDAYRIARHLLRTGGRAAVLSGATGELALTSAQRFYRRQLVWARFERGLPVPLTASPAAPSAAP